MFRLLSLLVFGVWLLEDAYALSPGSGDGSSTSAIVQFLPLIAIFGIFWFLIIRPQQKRLREHRRLMDDLREGDKVWTESGFQGVIKKLSGNEVSLEIAPKVLVKLRRARIAERIGKGGGKAGASKKSK